jgi:hypothetical protein
LTNFLVIFIPGRDCRAVGLASPTTPISAYIQAKNQHAAMPEMRAAAKGGASGSKEVLGHRPFMQHPGRPQHGTICTELGGTLGVRPWVRLAVSLLGYP